MRHPGVAGRVKTRYAACIVLNSKRDVIKEMGEEGLLEDTDIKLLLKVDNGTVLLHFCITQTSRRKLLTLNIYCSMSDEAFSILFRVILL